MARRAAYVMLGVAAGAHAAAAYRPLVNYQLNCQGCHLADGSGEAGRVPSIRRTLLALSAVPAGRRYVIRVPGVAESPLSDAATAALLNWMVHKLSDVPAQPAFAAYTAAEVARWRRHPLADPAAIRARLLRSLGIQPASRTRAIASRNTAKSPM
ncbi:MAG TPA: hypothetical protein VND80_10080 [Steroidobacteraceae bacterium]|nr:hypothetical protein [Steroidobacteraceae bacterium]